MATALKSPGKALPRAEPLEASRSASRSLTSQTRHRIVLFTKPAVPGLVKTRLQTADGSEGPVLSAVQAAGLHKAFLEDVSGVLQGVVDRRSGAGLAVAWALDGGFDPEPGFEKLLGFEQVGESLGSRLLHGLSWNEVPGGCPGSDATSMSNDELVSVVLAVGSDHPELHMDAVTEAVDVVSQGRADLVLGPAHDGGYYLLAVREDRLDKALFEEVDWSTSRVLEQTLERARSLGMKVHLLAPGFDCDTPSDLLALCNRLTVSETGKAIDCEFTRRWLRENGLLEGEMRTVDSAVDSAVSGAQEAAASRRH